MMEKALAHHQLDWRYLSLDISPEDLEDAVRGIRGLGFAGGHCAGPYKQSVIPLLNRLTEKAEMIGAVNLIFREEDELVGDNTEGRGFIDALQRLPKPTEDEPTEDETPKPEEVTEKPLAEKKVVLLGAGRMARAIGVELSAAGIAEITIVSRNPAPARGLAKLLAEKFQVGTSAAHWEEDYELPDDVDLLINATTIGYEDPDARVPLVLESLSAGTTVADVTADPPRTRLLGEAAERGCQTLDGLSMYIDQVAAGFKLWTGVDPDSTVMREAVEEFLEI
jgi:shikimate dehydrogenase